MSGVITLNTPDLTGVGGRPMRDEVEEVVQRHFPTCVVRVDESLMVAVVTPLSWEKPSQYFRIESEYWALPADVRQYVGDTCEWTLVPVGPGGKPLPVATTLTREEQRA